MNVVIIIQARMGSTRLPGKILKPLGKKTVLDYVVDACKRAKKANLVVVATSNLKKDDQVEKFLKDKKIECFRGSESNVLSRYYYCAVKYKADLIVRVTADCPFLDPVVIDMLIEKAISKNYDRVATIDNNHPRTFPYGIDAEIISFSALKKAFKEADTDFDKEHVTPYIHTTKKEEFLLYRLDAPKNMQAPHIRVTIDTPEDYELSLKLIKLLPKVFDTEDIIRTSKNIH